MCRPPGSNASRAKKSPLWPAPRYALGQFLKTGAAFWMDIQARFDRDGRRRARTADQEDCLLTRRRESDADRAYVQGPCFILFRMVTKWRAIENQTQNFYIIEITV